MQSLIFCTCQQMPCLAAQGWWRGQVFQQLPSIAGQHAATLLHSGHQPLLTFTAAA